MNIRLFISKYIPSKDLKQACKLGNDIGSGSGYLKVFESLKYIFSFHMACLEFRKKYFWKTLIYATYLIPFDHCKKVYWKSNSYRALNNKRKK